jgi:hypothetical protein
MVLNYKTKKPEFLQAFVPGAGLEPARPKRTQDFKSCVSTSSTTPAKIVNWYKIKRAGDGVRTRDLDLGKVALYQLSYSRIRSQLLNGSANLDK